MGIKNMIVKGFSLLKPIPLKDKIINYASLEVAVKGIFAEIKKKEPKITRTDTPENDSHKVLSAKGALNLLNKLTTLISTSIEECKKVLRVDIAKKQNKDDSTLTTVNKTIVGGINENVNKLENLGDKVVENFGAGDDPSGIFTIQQTGAKIAGYRYFDTANKIAFKCIKNNSLTYADAECYEAVDNVSLNNKLQNLSENITIDYKSLDPDIYISGMYNNTLKFMLIRIASKGKTFATASGPIEVNFNKFIPQFLGTDFCINDGGIMLVENIGGSSGYINISYVNEHTIRLNSSNGSIKTPIYLRGTVVLQLI